MSSSLALSCLPSVKKLKHDFFCFVQFIIKQLLDSVFVISIIIKVSRSVITPTLTLIILDVTETSSNNCLLFCLKKVPHVEKLHFIVLSLHLV